MSLEVQNLSYDIGGRRLFENVSFLAQPGSLTAIVGPSGCGKTSLLNCLSGLLRPSSGYVLIDNQESTKWREKEILKFWQKSAAFVYQDHGLIDDESVAYNVSFDRPRYRFRKKRITADVINALSAVGLASRAEELASHLSGGERQRVAIARALYRHATYLFVDEPTASLDLENRKMVLELLRTIANSGATILIATHDEELMAAADQRVSLA